MKRHLFLPSALMGILLFVGTIGTQALAQVHSVVSYLYNTPDTITEVVHSTYSDIT